MTNARNSLAAYTPQMESFEYDFEAEAEGHRAESSTKPSKCGIGFRITGSPK